MSFDADAFAAAHAPWVFHADGADFPARDPSVDDVLRFRAEVLAAGTDPVAQERALRNLLRAMFPPSVRYIWTGHPVRKFLRLPTAAREAALTAFFARPAMQTRHRRNPARGNGSANRTATPSAPMVAP